MFSSCSSMCVIILNELLIIYPHSKDMSERLYNNSITKSVRTSFLSSKKNSAFHICIFEVYFVQDTLQEFIPSKIINFSIKLF